MKNKKKNLIELYHFTSVVHLPLILKNGLRFGDVPMTPELGYNAPSLTESRTVDHQSLMLLSNVDKTQVRITVEFEANDPNLFRWRDLSRILEIDRKWFKQLDIVGGHSSNHWYNYAGVIYRERFKAVEYREDKANGYKPFDEHSEYSKELMQVVIDKGLEEYYAKRAKGLINLSEVLSMRKASKISSLV